MGDRTVGCEPYSNPDNDPADQGVARRVRPLKFIVGLLLLPLLFASARTLVDLAGMSRPENLWKVSLEAWSLLGGFIFWTVLFLAMRKPMRTYVLGHELTHALWGTLLGARVRKVRISAQGGSVQLSKTNFLITLAPYFFPFYTCLVLALYGLLLVFFDLRHYQPFWMSLIGLTWGFHLTFTIMMLLKHQNDITDNGYLFSYVVIFLANILILCLGIVVVGKPTLENMAAGMTGHLNSVFSQMLAPPLENIDPLH